MSVTNIENSPHSLLDELRIARESSSTAFMKFIENREKFLDYVFCFYEGEDGKYYNSKIKTILGDKIIPLVVGNKNETLKVWRIIKSKKEYENVMKMFFIDRDMDEIPCDCDNDLYITPCYSIENLYANRETFINILETEFFLNSFDNDYKKCLEKFETYFHKFNEFMLEFNALVFIRKNANNRVCLKKYKKNHFVNITIDSIAKGAKNDEHIEDLKALLNCNEEDINNAKKELLSTGTPEMCFRGKNQLDFLVTFIIMLKAQHASGEFFEKKQNAVRINLTNNCLAELSQYAIFPQCLSDFIISHKIN